jgi:hypothetical protein
MVELRSRTGLTQEAGAALGAQETCGEDLDRDVRVEEQVPRLPEPSAQPQAGEEEDGQPDEKGLAPDPPEVCVGSREGLSRR